MQLSSIENLTSSSKNACIIHLFPGQRIQDGSGRNTREVMGTWKQYSGRKISGFFPVHSDHFPMLSRQKLVGNHRKFSGRNPASMFR